MPLSMLDGLGLQQLPPRFTHFADHVAHSRPRVNTRPIAAAATSDRPSVRGISWEMGHRGCGVGQVVPSRRHALYSVVNSPFAHDRLPQPAITCLFAVISHHNLRSSVHSQAISHHNPRSSVHSQAISHHNPRSSVHSQAIACCFPSSSSPFADDRALCSVVRSQFVEDRTLYSAIRARLHRYWCLVHDFSYHSQSIGSPDSCDKLVAGSVARGVLSQ